MGTCMEVCMKNTTILTSNGIDLEKSLELFVDMATYEQMLKDFLREVHGKLSKAKAYKESADMANYAIMVHSLKSDCRYFGITHLADMFYEHELAGKSNNFYFVTNNFEELEKETEKIVNVLNRYMGVDVSINEDSSNLSPEQKIIVVDDSGVIRTFMQKIFKDKYDVKIASDGAEAISLIANIPHDKIVCMFLDLNMPNVDGFEVLNYLQSNNLFDKVPVSIITGLSDSETIKRAFTYPIVDILQKPFNEVNIKNVALRTISRKKQ